MPSMFRTVPVALALGIAALVAPGAAPAQSRAPAASSDAVRADVRTVENYLNGITTLTGRFTQISSDGAARGRIWLSRPGRARFEYDPPTPVLIISDSVDTVYVDLEMNNTTFFDLADTPVGLLLDKTVSLSGDVAVTGHRRQGNVIRLTVIRTGDPQAGSVDLVFRARPMELMQWTVHDPQGISTTVTLSEVEKGRALDGNLFRIRRFSPNTRWEGD